MVNWSARRFRRNERAVLRSNAQNKANSSLADLGLGIDLWPAASGLCRAIAPNKPNSARRAGLVPGEGDCAKQSQFPAGPDGRALRPIMRNKANSRRGREDGGREPFPGRWRKTKPIWGSTRGGSLLCETKPIRWQVVEGKGFMVDWSARRFHRNERTLLRSNAQNKPNLPGEPDGPPPPHDPPASPLRRRRLCETKPISTGSAGGPWSGHQDGPTVAIYAGGDGGGSVYGGWVLPAGGRLCHHRGHRVQKHCIRIDIGDVR
jgi:hypothetical protein